MPTLGGSVFAHNAVKYDYCLRESIASLCGVCDKVVALDASSDDGTLDLIYECQKEFPNLQVVHGMPWDCAPNYERLAILANKAKEFLDTDWHFMLQADEVIHEKSYLAIKKAINNKKGFDSFLCRRINLFGDMYHYLKFDLPQSKKPCSDAVNRLAHLHYGAIGDAESLGTNGDTCCPFHVDEIQIWHYGLVRDSHIMCDKVIDMQSWFFGEGSQPDHRVVESKNTTGIFEWKKFKDRSDIDRIPWKHPQVSQEWANKRQANKEPVV